MEKVENKRVATPSGKVIPVSTTIGPNPPLATAAEGRLVQGTPRKNWLSRILGGVDAGWEWCFGVVSLLAGLALLASFPLLQLLSLGYLLEVSGRIASTGRLREGWIGIRKAARVGSLVLGTWLILWLPRFASSLWNSAALIDADSGQTRLLRGLVIGLMAWVTLHVSAACLRGGRLRHFLWPRPIRFLREMRSGGYQRARDAVWEFVVSLRLPHYFWLGFRGFLGGMVWLAPPITLLAFSQDRVGMALIGGLLLAIAIRYLPFLQARFAMQNRFGALFEVGHVRAAYRRAPLAHSIALALTLVLAVPLYLLKIEAVPREVVWLPSLLFVISMLPARLCSGWATARADRRDAPRHVVVRSASWLLMLPLLGFYVAIVYFTQFLSWHGVWSLYEQHAFLVPVPFLGS